MRCYNGAPDSELQAVYDRRDEASRRLREADPEARCVYFPAEGQYSVWLRGREISPMCDSMVRAIHLAIEEIEKLGGAT